MKLGFRKARNPKVRNPKPQKRKTEKKAAEESVGIPAREIHLLARYI